MSVIKKDLVTKVAQRTGLQAKSVNTAVGTILDTMREGIARDGVITVRNFGVFKIKHLRKRRARNPYTNERIIAPACRSVKFKTGKRLSVLINKP